MSISRIRSVFRRRRVPVILQGGATECGAACLAMVLSYHGRASGLSDVREAFGAGRDGVKARTIVRAGREQGLNVRAFSVQMSHIGQIALPAILHWGFNHFVVLERCSRRGAQIVDPENGRRQVGMEELHRSFTGIALTFEPGPAFETRSARRSSAWVFALAALRAPGVYRGLAQAIGASLLLQVFALSMPFFMSVIVDHALPSGTTDMLLILGLGMAAVVLAQAVTNYLRGTLLVYLQARLDAHIMLGLFEHLLALPYRFFQLRTSGDLLARLGSGAVIRELVTNQTLSVLLDGSLLVVCLGALLISSPLFGALVLAGGLLQVVVLLATSGALRDMTQRHLIAAAESQSFAIQAIKGIATVKASAAEPLAMQRWTELLVRDLTVSASRNRLSALVGSLLGALRAGVPFALLWLGAGLVREGEMSPGTMLGLASLASIVLTPLASLVSTGQQLQLGAAHLSRLADLLGSDPDERNGSPLLAEKRGLIELRGVSFRYDTESAPVVKEISATIEPGQKVAIVGKTGSGKSTLARLLVGLLPPTEGDILLDGAPMSQVDRKILRDHLGVVFQEPFLFSGSIRSNIALHDPQMPMEQVEQAARLSAIHEEIERMPMRYETWLGEDGGGLSGGQKQRVSLARALAHTPSVLVLDEATSHLDVATEARVDKSLEQLSCTRVVIAHRLSTVRNAQKILVLEEGALVEQGTHEELLAQNGVYAAIVRSQPGPTEKESKSE